jgi:methylenetetrahydrofolate dehydrogenase (NADP+)/methenyltetrahydrofolate cyclohydrolase
MLKIIDGRAIASRVKDSIAKEVFAFKGGHPSLAIIMVGERDDSKIYVSLKEKEGRLLGIDTHLYKLSEDAKEEEILEVIYFLNKDEAVDGMIVQLPLPKHLDADRIIAAINPQKDADGFCSGHPDYVKSPVLAAIEASLAETAFVGQGKKAAIFYNSEVFGQEVRRFLESRGLEIISKDDSIEADLIVTACGRPASIKAEMVKEGALIIDIGISRVDGQVVGDVDEESLASRSPFITPVPGGIGPMTIAFLFKNVLELYKNKKR